MDIGLPKLNGLEATRQIRELLPAAKLIFLTHETDADVVRERHSVWAHADMFSSGMPNSTGCCYIGDPGKPAVRQQWIGS